MKEKMKLTVEELKSVFEYDQEYLAKHYNLVQPAIAEAKKRGDLFEVDQDGKLYNRYVAKKPR